MPSKMIEMRSLKIQNFFWFPQYDQELSPNSITSVHYFWGTAKHKQRDRQTDKNTHTENNKIHNNSNQLYVLKWAKTHVQQR